MSRKSATILGSEYRLMESKITGRTYRISISLPLASFESTNKSWPFVTPLEKWPVVYLTDANWYFGMVTEITRQMSWCESTTEAIIVGIGYPEDENPQESWRSAVAGRDYDYTPARDEVMEKYDSDWLERKVISGGAPRFLQFIKQELIPVIESEYSADPCKRVLAGHSRGAMFATFALFEEPSLFDTYLIASPVLSDSERYYFKLEEAFSRKHKRLKARVFLSAGDLEEDAKETTVTDVLRFAAILESRKYKGLTLRKQIFPNLNHCKVGAVGFQTGLKFALYKK